jgi:hypothetical protein
MFSLWNYRQICGRQYLNPVPGAGYNRTAPDHAMWTLFNAYSGYEVEAIQQGAMVGWETNPNSKSNTSPRAMHLREAERTIWLEKKRNAHKILTDKPEKNGSFSEVLQIKKNRILEIQDVGIFPV